MFSKFSTKDVTVKVVAPEVVAALGTDEVVVTVQKLSARSLEKARTQRTIEQAPPLRAFGAELLKGLKTEDLDRAAAALRDDLETKRKARYDAHDRESTLVAGIVRWSCQDKVALSPQAIADLDEDSAQQLHEAILDYSLPPITAEEVKAKEGESSGRSTAS